MQRVKCNLSHSLTSLRSYRLIYYLIGHISCFCNFYNFHLSERRLMACLAVPRRSTGRVVYLVGFLLIMLSFSNLLLPISEDGNSSSSCKQISRYEERPHTIMKSFVLVWCSIISGAIISKENLMPDNILFHPRIGSVAVLVHTCC